MVAIIGNIMRNENNLKSKLTEAVEEVFKREIAWNHQFLKTYRKNGEVVEASPQPRDTIDERETLNSLEVSISDKGFTLSFSDEDAEYVFGYRQELDEYIIEQILSSSIKEVVETYLDK